MPKADRVYTASNHTHKWEELCPKSRFRNRNAYLSALSDHLLLYRNLAVVRCSPEERERDYCLSEIVMVLETPLLQLKTSNFCRLLVYIDEFELCSWEFYVKAYERRKGIGKSKVIKVNTKDLVPYVDKAYEAIEIYLAF